MITARFEPQVIWAFAGSTMLVIFDWDGTLLDTLAKITHCLQLAARDAGLEPRPGDDIRSIAGLGLAEALATLYPQASQAPLDLLRERYSRHFLVRDQTRAPNSKHRALVTPAGRGKGGK